MAATRARKTPAAKAASEDAPDEATKKSDAAPADTDKTPAAPGVAPLEPPSVDEAPKAPAPSPYAMPTEVIPDTEHLAEIILDDATGKLPANPDAVFVPLTPFGSTLQCTVRLVEKTFLGPHRTPVTRLLQPRGAVVTDQIAARIRERLAAQAASTDTAN